MRKVLWLFSILVALLTACSVSTVDLPLAEGKPTFLFFYTDG